MSISVLDLFKIGIGPSSSHTMGPMCAASEFVQALIAHDRLDDVRRVEIRLYGSLAATGIGHGTDHAVIVGLMGQRPDEIDPDFIAPAIENVRDHHRIILANRNSVQFEWERDMRMMPVALPYHPNALRLIAHDNHQIIHENTYYSIGGGFVIDESQASAGASLVPPAELPHEFNSAASLLSICRQHSSRICDIMLENERTWRSDDETREALLHIWNAMRSCVARGIAQVGVLPGGLKVRRRAHALHEKLNGAAKGRNFISDTLAALDWVNLYALAVNEENAGGGRVVTAPTNGAAGVIPAVLHYYMNFFPGSDADDVIDFLLTAAAIGTLCKKNASISGAEVGCQGEVGSACAMAAAGLTQVMGGTPEQIENAAEIALEHNLGLTCDPVAGLVQLPCIERNAMAAVKAINAAQLALRGDGTHAISLDAVIRTMRDTGRDMLDKYKETSQGGLAVNFTEC